MPRGKEFNGGARRSDKPPQKDSSPRPEGAGVPGWNVEATRRSERRAGEAKERGEGPKDRLAGKDTSRSWRELDRALPDPAMEDRATEPWLRPSHRDLELGKGAPVRISDADWRELKKLTGKEGLLSFQERSNRAPFERGPLLFLTSPDTAELRWTAKSALKEGTQVLNGNWVYQKGKELQMAPRYAEDRTAIAAKLRERRGEPLVDVFAREKPEKQLVEKIRTVNGKLNQWTDGFLRDGCSLQEAREKTHARAVDEFKGAAWQLANLCLTALTPGGIAGPTGAKPSAKQFSF